MFRLVILPITTTCLLVLAPACGDDTDDATPEAASTSGADSAETGSAPADDTAADGSTGATDPMALYDCVDPEFAGGPLMGPGFDASGMWIGPDQDSYVAHTTQIMVDPAAMDDFDTMTEAIGAQLQQTPGLLGVAFASEPNCGFLRTLGVWEDDASMLAFVGSGAHAQAMTHMAEVAITGRTTRWTLAADALPLTWEAALEQIDSVAPIPVD